MAEVYWECEVCGLETLNEYEKQQHIKETAQEEQHKGVYHDLQTVEYGQDLGRILPDS